MTLEKEKIEELKKQHGRVLQAKLEYQDGRKETQTIEFLYRPPSVAEIERLQSTAQKSPVVANLSLLSDIIVHPKTETITEVLKDLPGVVGPFIQTEVLSFLGEYHKAEVTEL